MKASLTVTSLVAVFFAMAAFIQASFFEEQILLTPTVQNNHSLFQKNYAQLSLHFEQNQGQVAKLVSYLSKGEGYQLFLTNKETVISLQRDKQKPATVVRTSLVNANEPIAFQGKNQLEGKTNYLIGRNKADWISNIPNYAEVVAKAVYPGIDLRYHGDQQQLEYDFIVAPGAQPSNIKLHFEGIDKLTLNKVGDLVLQTPQGTLYHQKPIIYQNIKGRRISIEGHYTLHPTLSSFETAAIIESNEIAGSSQVQATKVSDVGFVVAAYDPAYPLIIDPILDYSTYLGGADNDQGLAIAVDGSGSAYVAGTTLSTIFPTSTPFQGSLNGSQDAFIAKLNPAGDTLIYATYFGGSGDDGEDENDDSEDGVGEDDNDDNDEGDSDNDHGMDIAVDSSGHLYITGTTNSDTDFPIINATQASYGGGSSDAYLAKLAPDGSSLIFSTYLGGSKQDKGFGIALDNASDIYVTGMTRSNNFPVVNAVQASKGGTKDAYIAKLSSDGSVVNYATYIGGSKADTGKAIAVDSHGYATITGVTKSNTNFPIQNALQSTFGGSRDAFVTQLSTDGSVINYSTYLGGSKKDKARSIAIDSQDNVFIVGMTKSKTDFPIVNALQTSYGGGSDDGFISKLSNNGSNLLFSTYLGGGKTDKLRSITLDNNDHLYVVGSTKSTSGIPTIAAIQPQLNGTKRDAMVIQLSNDGSQVLFGSYFGGSKHDRGRDIAVNGQDIFITGITRSDLDFPLQNAIQPLFGGGNKDAFIAKIGSDNLAPLITSTPSISADVGQAYSYDVDATDQDNDILQYSLDIFPTGMVIAPDTGVISWIPDAVGDINVSVTVDDNQGGTDSQSFVITVTDNAAPVISITHPSNGSLTNNPQLTLTGSIDKPATLTINGQNVTVNPDLSFSKDLTLALQGANTITLTATTAQGNTATSNVVVILDTLNPIISLSNPPSQNTTTNIDQLTITGSISENVSLSFNNVSVPINADNTFSIGSLTLVEGLNSYTLNAVDNVGNASTQLINVTLDTVLPVLTINSPQNDTLTSQNNILFSGTVTKPVNLIINGQASTQNADQSFSSTIILAEGLNNVIVSATDTAGNNDSKTLNITVDTTPPVLNATLINRGNPQNQIVMVVGLAGAAEPGSLVHITNPSSGYVARTLAQSDGSFSTDVAGFANDSFTIYTEDAAGNQSATQSLSSSTPLTLTLDPIGNKIAPLGEITRFTVTANDNAGNPVSLGLTPVPLPAGMQYNITTGEFSFKPTNGQEGDYTLVFSALSGDEHITETINLTVPAINQAAPTELTGRILDASGMQGGSIVPIVGATVSFLSTGVSTTTDAQGYFTLTALPITAMVFDIDTSTAQLGSNGESYASFREQFPLVNHVTNVVERPLYMPQLATDSLTTVDPAQSTLVENTALGISLNIAPGNAINDSDGSLFNGQISISEVPRNLAPANLPEIIDPALLFTIQPVGISYTTPVPITVNNTEDYAPGSEVDLWSVDPNLGIFVIVGKGQVTADGSQIITIEGGIRANDWHAFLQLVMNQEGNKDNKDPNNPNPGYCEECGSSMFSLQSGQMSTSFNLPAYRSLETSRSLKFRYGTYRANPQPVIEFNTAVDVRSTVPDTVSYQLEVAGLKQGQEVFIDTSGFSESLTEPLSTAITFKASDFHSGMYDYRLEVTSNFNGGSKRSRFVNGKIMVVNQQQSPFGAGWMLEGLFELSFNPDNSVTLIAPNGRSINYQEDTVADTFISPANDYATFIRNPDGSYTHTEKNGIKMHFDAVGKQSQHEDRNHNTTHYAYDASGKLDTITDPVGLVTSFAYDNNSRLQTVTDPSGRVSTFTIDAAGDLTKITYPDGNTDPLDNAFETFEYDNRHLMEAHEDERQKRYTDRYNIFGRIIDGTLPDGTIRAASGKTTAALIDVSSGIGTLANPAPVVRPSDVKGKYIDGRNHPSSRELDSHGRILTHVDELGRTTIHSRDADSNPTQTQRPTGAVVTRTFDNFGNTLTQKEEFNGATTLYDYDNFSLVTKVTNPRQHATTINRDPANGNPLSIVNHLLHTTTMEYDDPAAIPVGVAGLVTKTTSPNGLITTYTYNAQGLMDTKTETPPAGSPGNTRLWTYSYFPTGLLQTVNTPDNITLTYTYDSRSYLKQVTDNLNQSIVYSYDAHRNVTKTETLSSDGSLARLVDTIYDNRNRLAKSKAPHLQVNGVTTEESITEQLLDENSNLKTLIDPKTNSSSNNYDEFNRLKDSTHREQGTTRYTYHPDQDRLTKIEAPNGVITEYRYDIIGRRTQEISSDRGTIDYGYDLANNVTTITEGRNITTTLDYDELERVETKSYPNTIAGKTEDVTYSYDTCAFGLGYLCGRTDESGNTVYDYDAFGNMSSKIFTEIEGTVYTTSYLYDDGDRLKQMTLPSNRVIDYTRDGVRRLSAINTTVNGNAQTVISNIFYRGDNQMLSCDLGNGLKDTRTYDLQGRLRSQQLTNQLNTPIDQRSYNYDRNSNIKTITSNLENNAYGYDKRDRLTSDTINTDDPNIFGYDLNDNRQSKSRQDLSQENLLYYQPASNRISSVETFQTGNTPIQSTANRELVYNDVGRLFQLIEDDNLKAEYIYNDQGQRTRKTTYQSDGLTVDKITIYHYDQMGYLITETTETGQLIKDYIWQEGMNLAAQIDNTTGTEQILYLYSDHLMTSRLATDQNQAIVWRWEGEAFGETAAQELAGFSVNVRFPGQYFDGETGLHYNRFRYYSPDLGRYITSDPIGLGGGLNTYLYANANPLYYTDPYGLDSFLITTYDYGIGSHSAFLIEVPGQPAFLFDPGGGYLRDAGTGSGGYITGDKSLLGDYLIYQLELGSDIDLTRVPLTLQEEKNIIKDLEPLQDPGGGFCASSISNLLKSCDITPTIWPGALNDQAKEIKQCQ